MFFVALPFLILLGALESCGPHEHEHASMQARAEGVQSWDGSPELGQRKRILVSSARALGADDDKVALLLAAAMLETDNLSAESRDKTKDASGLSRNFSAFNMNLDALQRIGWPSEQTEALNNDAALPDAVKAFMQGIDKMGLERWLCFHRGGASAAADGVSYGAQEYKTTIFRIRDHLKSNPQSFSDDRRYSEFVQHV